MRIKQLEIDNFKSFANKVEIPFLQGFTTISGPNGSGKSNIIDSILFALGLATSRTLRSESGVADFITTHNNRNEASVRVVFERNDGSLISFTRKIKKTSQGYTSTYYMNDKVATLTQIHLELEKHNITPNSYNVIMQGDVTSIIKCSGVERRKILDEIAGVADFDRKIEQATSELETVEERVARSNIVLGEIDQRLEQLASERESALKYKALQDQRQELESKVTSVKYFDAKKSLDIVHENILNANNEKKDFQKNVKELIKKIEEQKILCEKISQEVRAKGEDKQLEVKKQAEEKKGEIERKTTSIAHCDKLIFENLKTIENAKNGIESLNEKNKLTLLSIEEKKVELQKTQDILAEQKEELNKILTEMGGLTHSADEHIKKRNELRHEYDLKKDEETNIIKEKLPLENEYNNLKAENVKIASDLEKFENSSKNFESDKDRLSMLVKKLADEMSECEIVQKSTIAELDKLKNQISDMEYNIRLANKKIDSMEMKRQAYKDFGVGAAVELIMSSSIKGVHAPLLQLMDVESKYADAIDIALGGRSRFIVVDNENTAVRAIDLLKSNDKRATFLPLNKMHKAPAKLALPKDKGVIDFAINLIDFDDIYLDAFYFALGDTLIVEDTQVAKKLMGKFRVITLDGDVFEKSGAITGGAKQKTKTNFGKADDNELKTYKQRLQEFEEKFEELLNKKKENENRLEKVREDYSSARNEYNEAKTELQNLIKNNETVAVQIEAGMLRQSEIAIKTKELEKKLDNFEQAHIKVSEEILSLQTSIEEIEKLIDEGELNKLKELTVGIENQIRETETKIISINADIDKENNNITFNNTIIEQRNTDINKCGEDNETYKNDKTKFEAEIKVFEEELVKLNEEIEELGKHLVELQTKRDEENKNLRDFERSKDLYDDKILRIDEQIESYKARRRELEPILDEARQELISAGVEIEKLEIIDISIDELMSKIQRIQRKMDEMGAVNMLALKNYEEVQVRQEELRQKIATLTNEKIEIATRMKGYEDLKKETFLNSYENVNKNFKEIFAELSEGEGKLVLENMENPFAGGLTFEATTRDKPRQKLASMSGGEKTLTALAFVFAVQKHQPAPFYALDEVDMHLDGPNVERLARMINKQSDIAQFVVISLRKPMIDSADRMIGVTQKEKGKTKISGIKLKDD